MNPEETERVLRQMLERDPEHLKEFDAHNEVDFAYTVNGVSQSKAITREVFRTPGTVCQ